MFGYCSSTEGMNALHAFPFVSGLPINYRNKLHNLYVLNFMCTIEHKGRKANKIIYHFIYFIMYTYIQ